ncbi:MAG: RagB/SusD family nutrient uptake outer membrane protein [Prevotella sp.]|nr:RagB/SusD family nutrient uptake outer membrane protein [Prevotella sp.]
MNKIFFKLLLIGFVLSLTACDDFLDKDVLGRATDETYYDTQYKMQSALDAVYDVLQSDSYNDQEWRFGEACADDVLGTDEGLTSQMGQLVNFRFNTSNTWILQRWNVNYKGIHRANQVIANIGKVNISTSQNSAYTAIRNILGQAKFLRAFYYFNLVKTFGGVPIRPEVEDVGNLVVPRSTKEECYAYIEKDLREAIITLPAIYPVEQLGKATRGAAMALLMKVLMYQATPGVPSQKWEEMKQFGEYFIDGKPMTIQQVLKYDGSEDWEALRQRLWFKPQNLLTESDPYEKPETSLDYISGAYSPMVGVYSLAYQDYYGAALHNGDKYSYVYQWYGDGEFCRGSVFEVVFKESADGSSGDTNEGAGIEFFDVGTVKIYCTNDIATKLFGTDVRRQYLIAHQTTTPDGEIWQGGEGRQVSLKWYTPKKDKPKFAGDNGRNRRVIRYVEVVLMYAEALNECGDREGAIKNLNLCKAQVNTINASTKLYVAGGYGYVRDQIYEERHMELAFEWDRFFDIVRQGRAAKVLHTFGANRYNSRGLYFRQGVNELFPIPQTEIDVSNGVVEQNPGY